MLVYLLSSLAKLINFCLEAFKWNQIVVINSKKYQIIEKIGEGGFSFVYLIKQLNSSEYFALKRIKIQAEEQKQAFHKEVTNHHRISNVHVIKLIDFQLKETRNACEGLLLLPYSKNGTLSSLIHRAKLKKDRILSLIIDICNGLLAFQ